MYIRFIGVIAAITLAACGGQGVTAEQEQRYNELETQLSQLSDQRGQLERKVKDDFRKSAQLEKKKRLQGKKSIGCGYQLKGQAFGPLPFKKRKGRSARLKSIGSSPLSGCASYTLRVQ